MILTAPRLFQRDVNGILDLQLLNPPSEGNQGDQGDPVVVSVLLPDALNSHLTVWFGGSSKLFPIANPSVTVLDCSFKRSELPPAGVTYDVSYEYGGERSPAVSVDLRDSMASFMPRHLFEADGIYPAGSIQTPRLIDVWAVPAFRLLLQNDPLIAPTATSLAVDVALRIVWKSLAGAALEVGEIAYSAARDQWSLSLHQACLTLQRGDMVAIESVVESEQTLQFSLLL